MPTTDNPSRHLQAKRFATLSAIGVATISFLIIDSFVPAQTQTRARSTAATAKKANPSVYPGLSSALWMHRSAEYRASCLQAYRLARLQLNEAWDDRSWTAAVEQKERLAGLPRAVVFDIDETLFNNSPYNARMAAQNLSYDERTWAQWNSSGRIQALPGALGFARYAARRGATLFYISNRSHEERRATLANLHRLGFPIRSRFHLLLKGERPDWTSDKTQRRRFVASRYRVLLLVGDDLNDFLSVSSKSSNATHLRLQRRQLGGS